MQVTEGKIEFALRDLIDEKKRYHSSHIQTARKEYLTVQGHFPRASQILEPDTICVYVFTSWLFFLMISSRFLKMERKWVSLWNEVCVCLFFCFRIRGISRNKIILWKEKKKNT